MVICHPTWVHKQFFYKYLNIQYTTSIGSPHRFFSAIRIMYKKSVVRLLIGKIDTSIPFKVGVKKGDSMSPVLFLFLIMEFAETLEK